MEKSCDEQRENGIYSWDEMGLTSSGLFPRNIPKQDFLDKRDSLVQHKVLIAPSSNWEMSYVKEQKCPRSNKQRKDLKSKNLRVCFASMSEELISLDHQWKKIEEMISSYKEIRKRIGKDLEQCTRDIDLLKEKLPE